MGKTMFDNEYHNAVRDDNPHDDYEPISTTMTIEEADATIKSLTSMLIAARTERDKLKAAIRAALASDGNTAYEMFFDMLE